MDVVSLLWEGQPTPRRGPRPAFTLDDIARAAVRVADAEGLAAVTMHQVASDLGVTKMALYRYVPGKAELVALMTESALGPPPKLPRGPWRARLDTWARAMFDRFTRHPWSLAATVGTRVPGPHELLWLERAVAALSTTPLEGHEILDTAVTLIGHVRAIAEQYAASAHEAPEQALTATMATLLRGREDQFPALSKALAAPSPHHDEALAFGLDRILDGVEHLIASRS
ncbi:TetR/AcrR family transcriptional regulator [Actinokineospora bangkokensis]|nr:TetR/AcrR family transcriptional regulator C-terminal domain-containing protein [Actinokineospora bangkokensis]